VFYRALTEKWLPHCTGAIAVECGEGQTAAIKNLFKKYCTDVSEQLDFNGIGRTVCGRKV
jgi:methylase of polypeptide subunit release factors